MCVCVGVAVLPVLGTVRLLALFAAVPNKFAPRTVAVGDRNGGGAHRAFRSLRAHVHKADRCIKKSKFDGGNV